MGVLTALLKFATYIATGTIVSDLWGGLKDVVTEAIGLIVDLFNGVVKVFYDSTSQTDKITVIGWLTLSAMGITFVLFGLKFVRSLIYKMKAR